MTADDNRPRRNDAWGDRVITYGSPKEQKVIARVYALGDPLCEAEGMELVHVEYQREPRGRILRLYIDKPGGDRKSVV